MPASLGVLYHEFRNTSEPFGLETLHFRQLCEMGQVRGMNVFVFTPDGCKHDERQVWGYRPDARGVWSCQAIPLPDVAYLRGVTMDQTSDRRMYAETTWLSSQGVLLFNSRALMSTLGDKWCTYEKLIAHPAIGSHLPRTLHFTEDGLQEMLCLYPIVMVKHRHGFESRGMIRIAHLLDGGYSCDINDVQAKRQRLIARSPEELADLLLRHVQPVDDFVIQQGINLARWQGRTFELRVILNKTDGRWLRTGMVIRHSIASDVPFLSVGGERNQRPSEIMPAVFGERSEAILNQVRTLARTITTELERTAGPGGELALDFGFDNQGYPWLIEGNSRPFNLFIRTGAYSLRRKNMARVLRHAQQLADGSPSLAGVLD